MKKPKKEHRYINQQAVTVHKQNSHDKGKYFTLDIKKNNRAMRDLSSVAYKMYVYLCQFQTETTHLLSCSKFMKATGLSEPSYRAAKKELLMHHYMNKREDGDYDFYNAPHIPTTKLEEKDLILNELIAKEKEKESADEKF